MLEARAPHAQIELRALAPLDLVVQKAVEKLRLREPSPRRAYVATRASSHQTATVAAVAATQRSRIEDWRDDVRALRIMDIGSRAIYDRLRLGERATPAAAP